MINKVLVSLQLAEIECNFDIFIPVNEVTWKIKKMLVKSIVDITDINMNEANNYILVNKISGKIYKNNDIIIDTDIRNATELILLSI